MPLLTKAPPLLMVFYLISPLDLVPDVLLLLGQIDDLVIIWFGLEIFLRLCPAAAIAFHGAAITGRRPYAPMSRTDDVIDAEWRRE